MNTEKMPLSLPLPPSGSAPEEKEGEAMSELSGLHRSTLRHVALSFLERAYLTRGERCDIIRDGTNDTDMLRVYFLGLSHAAFALAATLIEVDSMLDDEHQLLISSYDQKLLDKISKAAKIIGEEP